MPTSLRTRAANVGLALFLFGIIVWGMRNFRLDSVIQLALLPLMAMTAVLAIRSLFRPPAQGRDERWWVYFVCVVSVVYVHGYQLDGNKALLVFAILWVRQLLANFALLSLGESYAMLPARRTVRTGFLYRLVRHPVYALYMVADLLIVLLVPFPANLLVAVVGALAFWTRARLEEKVLRQDPTYEQYMQTVRWRFVPGIA